jgi:hypothetical protein
MKLVSLIKWHKRMGHRGMRVVKDMAKGAVSRHMVGVMMMRPVLECWNMMFSLSLGGYWKYVRRITSSRGLHTGPAGTVHCIKVVLLISFEMSLSHTMYLILEYYKGLFVRILVPFTSVSVTVTPGCPLDCGLQPRRRVARQTTARPHSKESAASSPTSRIYKFLDVRSKSHYRPSA